MFRIHLGSVQPRSIVKLGNELQPSIVIRTLGNLQKCDNNRGSGSGGIVGNKAKKSGNQPGRGYKFLNRIDNDLFLNHRLPSLFGPWNPREVAEWGFSHPFFSELGFETPQRFLGLKNMDYFKKFCVDMTETKDKYVISADLPGIDKSDIEVTLKDGILTLKAERKSEYHSDDKQDTSQQQAQEKESNESENKKNDVFEGKVMKDKNNNEGNISHFCETHYGKFERQISLPDDIIDDPSQIIANYNNGVLKLEIPKLQPSKQDTDDQSPFKINIQ